MQQLKLSLRRGTEGDLEQAAQLAAFLQPTMFVSADLLRAFLNKYAQWYLHVAELPNGQLVGYDIRYAVDAETLMVHQSGVLPEYVPGGLWRDLATHAQLSTGRYGFTRTQSYLQDYSVDMLHLSGELGGRVFGFHHNRYMQAGVQNIGALTIEMPNNTHTVLPPRLRKPSFAGMSLTSGVPQDGFWTTFSVDRDGVTIGAGRFRLTPDTIWLDVVDGSEDGLWTSCCAADLLAEEYRRPVAVSDNRCDLIASMFAVHLVACGYRAAVGDTTGQVYLYRRYPRGLLSRKMTRASWQSVSRM